VLVDQPTATEPSTVGVVGPLQVTVMGRGFDPASYSVKLALRPPRVTWSVPAPLAAHGPTVCVPVAGILAPRWVSRVITWKLAGKSPAELRLRFGTDDKARATLEEELFGKRILFSDKGTEEASTATIVAEYRSQETVEGDFRQMKDPKVVSFSPMFHWTESKIRVHIFYCVLALMTARLMVREADRAGMHLSVRELLAELAGIQETVLLYQGETGRSRARRMLTDIDPVAQRLYDLFGLDA
jgi:hypothetical protein